MLAFSSKRVLLPRSRSTATASLSLSLSSRSARVFAAHRRTFLTEKFRKVMYGEEEDGGETKEVAKQEGNASLGLGDRFNMFMERSKAEVQESRQEENKKKQDEFTAQFFQWLADKPHGKLTFDEFLEYNVNLYKEVTGAGTWREKIPGEDRKKMMAMIDDLEGLRAAFADNGIADGYRVSEENVNTVLSVTKKTREEVLNYLKEYVNVERTQRWLRRRRVEGLSLPGNERELIVAMCYDKRGLPPRGAPPKVDLSVTHGNWRQVEALKFAKKRRVENARARLEKDF